MATTTKWSWIWKCHDVHGGEHMSVLHSCITANNQYCLSHRNALGKYACDAYVGDTILIFVTVADLRRLDLFLHAIAE